MVSRVLSVSVCRRCIQAAEVFLDRCVWGAVRLMNRTGRKVVTVADLVSALKLHPCPEAMQYFVEELQPAPPPPPPKPPTAKDNQKKKAPPPKKGKPAEAAVEEAAPEEPAPPEKKRAPPSKRKAATEEPAPEEPPKRLRARK